MERKNNNENEIFRGHHVITSDCSVLKQLTPDKDEELQDGQRRSEFPFTAPYLKRKQIIFHSNDMKLVEDIKKNNIPKPVLFMSTREFVEFINDDSEFYDFIGDKHFQSSA